jgi:hypothetical protein
LLGSCAGSAPPLPQNRGTVKSDGSTAATGFSTTDLAKDCAAIDAEQAEMMARMRALRSDAAATHEDNQNIGFVASVLFPPAWLATTDTSGKTAEVHALQRRWDKLLVLERHKDCGKSASPEND